MQNETFNVILQGDVPAREMMPGGNARFYHTNHMSLAVWEFVPGTILPEHCHPHEQITTMLDGQFEMNLDGQVYILEKGTVVTIPPDVVHSGRALTASTIIDAFYPVREDFLQ